MQAQFIQHQDTHPLRHLVLWPHIRLEKDCIIEVDQHPEAMHIGVFHQQKIISIGSIFKMNHESLTGNIQYRLRAMATHPDYHHRQAGKLLIDFAKQQLIHKEADLLWCNARKIALGFYIKQGFEITSDWYEIPHVGLHKTMCLRFKQSLH